MVKANLASTWVEVAAFGMLVVGFFLAFFIRSAAMSYLIIFLGGTVVGGMFYIHRKNFPFKWAIIALGFLIGFVLGNSYGKDILVVLFFVLGGIVSYGARAKGFEWFQRKK